MAGKLIYFMYDSANFPNGPSFRPDIVDLDNDPTESLSKKIFRGAQGPTLIVVSDKSKASDGSIDREVIVLEALAVDRGWEFHWCVGTESMVQALICV